jgi:hypothetical protein
MASPEAYSVGIGVLGMSELGTGVRGQSSSGTGVFAASGTGTALNVVGKSSISCNTNSITPALGVYNSGLGISVISTSNIGLESFSPVVSVVGYAINPLTTERSQDLIDWGTNPNRGSVGLLGYTQDGKGVVGFADTGIGMLAKSVNGIALQVEGTSNFNGKSNITANTPDLPPALMVSNNSETNGIGISAYSKSHIALIAHSDSSLPAIQGFTLSSFGVSGWGFDWAKIPPSKDFVDWCTNPNRGTGGILGYTKDGKGVVGFSDTDIGVLAISKGKSALRVEGKSSFSSVGRDVIPANKLTYKVHNDFVTADSHVNITLLGDTGILVRMWVTRSAGVFTIHFSDKIKQNVPFSYFIVEP